MLQLNILRPWSPNPEQTLFGTYYSGTWFFCHRSYLLTVCYTMRYIELLGLPSHQTAPLYRLSLPIRDSISASVPNHSRTQRTFSSNTVIKLIGWCYFLPYSVNVNVKNLVSQNSKRLQLLTGNCSGGSHRMSKNPLRG